MVRIIGIAGSLRRGSYSSALLRASRELVPADAPVEIATIAGIPLYGLLLVTPEYNN